MMREIPARLYQSLLDSRVWIASMEGVPVGESEAMATTSLRRLKEYVEEKTGNPHMYVWVKLPDGSWEYLGGRDE